MERSAQPRQPEKRDRRRRWMLLLFLLLPGALGLGLIAPSLVRIVEAQEQVTPEDSAPNARLQRPPLLVPNDFSTDVVPELIDLQNLFSTRIDPMDPELLGMLTFPQNRGEMIVLDDVGEHPREVPFEDVLAAAVLPTAPFPDDPFLMLGNSLPRGDGLRYDDFPGDGNGAIAFVPEPATALLLGGGLFVLGAMRRRLAA